MSKKKIIRHLAKPKGLKERLYRSRWQLTRRLVQLAVMVLFMGTARLGWTLFDKPVLNGDLSASSVLDTVPLADPLATLERLLAGHLPTITVLTGALLVVLLYGFLGSRVFCGWICPMNTVSEAAEYTRVKLGLNADLMRIHPSVRYVMLAVALLLSALTGTAAFEVVSPQAIIWRDLAFGTGLGALSAALAVFALDLAVMKNGWCGHLCPLGAFWALVGRLSPRPALAVGFKPERCTRCADCLHVCPEPQVIKFKTMDEIHRIPNGECLSCGRCIEICPEDALSFQCLPSVHPESENSKEINS